MKNLFTILFSFLVSIYSIGCDSSNSSTNSSDCPFLNQSRGCDGVCAENPLTYDACGVCVVIDCDLDGAKVHTIIRAEAIEMSVENRWSASE